ncbi:MAG: glycosyltransferase [Wolinella sp.]
MKRIIQLSTYPIKNPLHGGQIRVSQIRKCLEKNNVIVKSISISETSHSDYTSDDILVSNHELGSLIEIPLCSDYATSIISTHGKYFEFIKKSILEFKPDAIFLEQPWLYPAIKKMREYGLLDNIKIIYSSQNIECKIKESLLDNHGVSVDSRKGVIDSIRELEAEICKVADTTICCTQIDADEFMNMGARQTIICNNGVSRRTISKESLTQVDDVLLGRRYALFVGSAYPPNAIGFWEMLGKSLAFLPPEYVILVAGGVSKILEEYIPDDADLYRYVNMDRIVKLGFVSEELLATLIAGASVILLPITIGGGSNLKTAEAIASCRPVVATITACRGFDVNGLSNFKATDSCEEFVDSVYRFLTQDNLAKISDSEMKIRETVYWDNTLSGLKALLD